MRWFLQKLLIKAQNLLRKKADQRNIYLSLLLDVESVAVAVWNDDGKGGAGILASSWQVVEVDTWIDRIRAADVAIVELSTKVTMGVAPKVVFGLPNALLTPSGDIKGDIRAEVKKLTKDLHLIPLGFVAYDTALAFALKQEEGVPASVILLGVSGTQGSLTVYKVGKIVERNTIEVNSGSAEKLEEALRNLKHVEVFPSRILLYGSDNAILESVKRDLMKHPWTTKMNFLHFPKIEIIPKAYLMTAVCIAGASQLPNPLIPRAQDKEPSKEAEEEERMEEGEERAEADVEPVEEKEDEKHDDTSAEEENIVLVEPEKLGFRAGIDILEAKAVAKKAMQTPVAEEVSEADTREPQKPVLDFRTITRLLPRISIPGGARIVPLVAGVAILFTVGGFSYWVFPKATVTIYELPMDLSEEMTVIVDPGVQTEQAQENMIPGTEQVKSISGEKTIAVSGKKRVGDPARGSVVIFNKSLASRTHKKGSVLANGTLRFTLDEDVSVASASENLVNGTVTFGKANGAITASTIGTQGNLSAGSEFSFQDISTTLTVARNDQELTGGTSREVTVVTREDQDILVGELTKELVDKAKGQLAAGVTGSEKLIDETIATKVIEKSFVQELDQETTDLQGNISIEVTGVSYNEEDILTLLHEALSTRVPVGYALVEGQGSLAVDRVVTQRDGKIRFTAAYETSAVTKLDSEAVTSNLAGKTITQAEEYLRTINGIGAVAFDIRWSPGGKRLPINKNNISLSVALQE